MSTPYTPDPAINSNSTFVVQLSQRDLSARVPVNYVNHPGVVLQAACFGSDNRYEETAFAKCFSNLLASGFRRIEADVFWDANRSTWSLCPVELGGVEVSLTTSTSTSATTSNGLANATFSASVSSAALTGRDAALAVLPRQNDETLSQSTAASTTLTTSASMEFTATLATGPLATSANGESPSTDSDTDDGSTLIQVGPYSCTETTDFALLVSVLSAHMVRLGNSSIHLISADISQEATDTNIGATTVTLMLNVHAAASASDPSGPSQQPDDSELPEGGSLLSSVLANNISTFIYTPSNLLSQRNNLNSSGSWFTVYSTSQPTSEYFTIQQTGGPPSSSNGWPSESFIEIPGYAKRLLIGFGDVDPQMANYNFSGDSSTIFPPQYLESSDNLANKSSCFFNPEETALTSVNSSWAVSSIGSGASIPAVQIPTLLDQSRNLTNCGISPVLNATLGEVSADQTFEPYRAFVESTVWSWGPDQFSDSNGGGDPQQDHCAALNATSGTWRSLDCSESRHGACRVRNELYDWSITYTDVPYDRVELACEDNAVFDAPRTALENRYLLSAWRQYRDESDDDDIGELLWLNFNDLDVEACWVVGQNTTCPYNGPQEQQTRRIVVPVVAGVIVFVLTALTILVKCAGNRQTSKRRRRRGEDGWDYEGVPS